MVFVNPVTYHDILTFSHPEALLYNRVHYSSGYIYIYTLHKAYIQTFYDQLQSLLYW